MMTQPAPVMTRDALKAQGARVLSELNDLKRTADSCANEIGWSPEEVAALLKGETTPVRMGEFIEAIIAQYPIDRAELIIPEDDCTFGVRLMRHADSVNSARVFNRLDRNGERTPYYEYRDTAMSRVSAFRPEWIEELRVVSDSTPDNPDVAYNNGHFMHQVTFFVGPVNFYWNVNGEKRCMEMVTGDSNYITPYWPHSFTRRTDTDEPAYIIAVTFGGDVKRSLGELYRYGKDRAGQYRVNTREPQQGVQDLIDFHARNEFLTRDLLQQRLQVAGKSVDVLDAKRAYSTSELADIAEVLNIEVTDLQLPPWRDGEEVVVRQISDTPAYAFPSPENARYQMQPGARCRRMPLVKSFHISVESKACATDLSLGLHTYLYNYSKAPICFAWTFQGETHKDTLQPGDSAFVQPFVDFGFCSEQADAKLFMVGIPGAVHAGAQRELSSFASFDRVVAESTCWFN